MTPPTNQGDQDPEHTIARLRQAIEQQGSSGSGGGIIDREAERAKAPVRKRALGLLNHRARSRYELRQRLVEADCDPDVVDEVLDDLESANLLDDEAFAREWVYQRHRRRGKSRLMLDRELQHKGVNSQIRAAALEDIDDDDEAEMAQAFADKKASKITQRPRTREEYDKQLRKIVGVLARRGFSQALSLRLARAALEKRCAVLSDDE